MRPTQSQDNKPLQYGHVVQNDYFVVCITSLTISIYETALQLNDDLMTQFKEGKGYQ